MPTLLYPKVHVYISPSLYKEPANTLRCTYSKCKYSREKDKTWISFDETATNYFDAGRDAWRLKGDAGMPQLTHVW